MLNHISLYIYLNAITEIHSDIHAHQGSRVTPSPWAVTCHLT